MLASLKSLTGSLARNRRGWVGIDLGSATAKVAEIEWTRDGYRLVRGLVVPRDTPLKTADWETAHEVFPALIGRRIARPGPLGGPSAAATVSMSAVELRTFSFAQTTDADLAQLVGNELESGDRAVGQFDWWTGFPLVREDQVQTYSMSMPGPLAAAIATELGKYGAIPQILDGLPHALARAVATGHSSEATIAAVDLGYSTATLLVVRYGRPMFVRSLRSCGLVMWHTAVAEAFGISPQEAGGLLLEQGMPDRSVPGSEVSDVLEDVLNPLLTQLANEIKRTLGYLKQEFTDVAPTELVLVGGGSLVPRLPEALEQATRVRCFVWTMLGTGGEPSKLGPLLAPAVGLSLLGFDDETQP